MLTRLNNGGLQVEKILGLLKSTQIQNDLVHSVLAMDRARIEILLTDRRSTSMTVESSQVVDVSYVFSWYKPTYRNLPVSLLELAFDTRRIDLIEIVLSLGSCDVNQLSSTSGDPFYFSAFDASFASIKSQLLRTSNLTVKNYHGQSVLFHIVKLYEHTSADSLLDDFCKILRHSPGLLAVREDQRQLTLIEWLIMSEHFACVEVFMRKISEIIVELLKTDEEASFKVFQDMINHGYGLILLNTPIYPLSMTKTQNISTDNQVINNTSGFAKTVTLEQYVFDNGLQAIQTYLKRFYDADFFRLVKSFEQAIRVGELNPIRDLLVANNDKFGFLSNVKDTFGRTCLHMAVLYNQKSVVK